MPVTPRSKTRRHVIEPLSYTEAAQSPALKGMMSFLDVTPEEIRKGFHPDVDSSLPPGASADDRAMEPAGGEAPHTHDSSESGVGGISPVSESPTGGDPRTGGQLAAGVADIHLSPASEALTGGESHTGSEPRTGSDAHPISEAPTGGDPRTGGPLAAGVADIFSPASEALTGGESHTGSESRTGSDAPTGGDPRTGGSSVSSVNFSPMGDARMGSDSHTGSESPIAQTLENSGAASVGDTDILPLTGIKSRNGAAFETHYPIAAVPPTVRFPIVKGAISSLNRRIRKCMLVQDGHSSVEELLYQVLWKEAQPNAGNPSGSRTLRMGYAEIAAKARLHKTNVRLNILSLKAKLAIDILDEHNSRDLVPRLYRVFSYKEILERRKIAGLQYVIRQKNVVFVTATGEPITLPGLHHATSKTKRAQDAAPVRDSLPVSDSHTGNESTASFIDPRLVYDVFVKYAPHVDQAAVFRLISSCQEQMPDVTQAELVDALCIKGEQVVRSGSAQNPTAVLLRAVPEWIGDSTFKLRREQIRKDEERAAAQHRLQLIESALLEKLQQLPKNNNWEAIKAYLREVIDPHSFDIWLKPLVSAWESNGVLSVLLPADCFHMVATRFRNEVSQAIDVLTLSLSEIIFLGPEEAYLALGCRT